MTHEAVLRFQLSIGPAVQNIDFGPNPHILSVAPARDGYYIDVWFKGEVGAENTTTVPFYVVCTGHPLPTWPDGRMPKYINFHGTCVMNDGLVWHVFTGTRL